MAKNGSKIEGNGSFLGFSGQKGEHAVVFSGKTAGALPIPDSDTPAGLFFVFSLSFELALQDFHHHVFDGFLQGGNNGQYRI